MEKTADLAALDNPNPVLHSNQPPTMQQQWQL